ncbi:DNA polymerase I [Bailinhaonella thermotolerans]|uniref:DNA polymerase I n=1 Tax=Bailinhaonella thermotolerans TaxID=1070861 RepID=A0A3A4AZQ2_9ACTN|nr:DNA polymerase I [Bailinhaonella thermotolerans]RJL24852.1 DNA polymerase I [Bailinhaonella thermotolerans]
MDVTPAQASRERLLLLDGHSLAYRAYYALKESNLRTTTGQLTTAVYGFTSMLINVLRDEQPTHVAVAFDRSEPTFRHETYTEYKANRSETPDDFRSQMPLIFEVLDTLGITKLSLPGFEADDIIATLATRAEAEGMEVLIVTGDRDALQLVTENVTVLMNRVGISNMTRFTPEAVQEKYGLTPAQYPDFAALRGDPSDNLPNIPGVGEKTATKWIQEFGSLSALVDRVDEVKGKAGERLREHLGNVVRNRELTQLLRDVPCGADPHELRMKPWDRPKIETLFDTLEFRGLRERLYEAVSAEEPEAEDGFEVELTVLGPGEAGSWLAEHAAGAGRLGVAFRGAWGSGTGNLDGIALSTAEGRAAFLDPTALTPEDEAALGGWLADPARAKAVHDSKGPLLALWARGLDLHGVTCDTALAAYLMEPDRPKYPLDTLSLTYLRRGLRTDAAENGQLTLDGSGEEEAARELALQARAVVELAGVLEERLDERGETGLLREVELPLVRVLAEMERTGIAADHDYFAGLEAQFAAAVKQATEEAHRTVGEQFNLGSPKQLQEILFNRLGLPKTRKIKSGYTTDADALAWLAGQTEHELPTILLRHRDQAKLRTTVEGLIKEISDDGRIHTTFNQIVAATGRLSSEKPNLQNIPIRTAEGRRIRQGFVVGEGYETLLTADYSQIELRIMAHLSGDESLIESFASGHDFHQTIAARVFDLPPEQIDGELRSRIKAMNYGLAYGLSEFGLSQQLGISPGEARGLMEEYFQEFGEVKNYLEGVVAQATRDGYTETMLGRRRYLPDLTSDNRQRRQMAERMALNAPIQGSAADIIKVAMLDVATAMAGAGLRSRMLLQVHDELVFEVAPGELDALRDLVVDRMSQAYTLRVPLEVSVGVGRTWEDAGH